MPVKKRKREGITTLGELREWINASGLPNETPISVNVFGMEGTGEFNLAYHKEIKSKNIEGYTEPAEIWIEDA